MAGVLMQTTKQAAKQIIDHLPEASDRPDIRELIFQGYRIIYLVGSNEVKIVTAIHGSKNLLV